MGRVFASGPEDQSSIPGCVISKTQKMLLEDASLNTQHYIRYGSRVKWNNPGKGVEPLTKESFRVALDDGHQLYLYIYRSQLQASYVSSRSEEL